MLDRTLQRRPTRFEEVGRLSLSFESLHIASESAPDQQNEACGDGGYRNGLPKPLTDSRRAGLLRLGPPDQGPGRVSCRQRLSAALRAALGHGRHCVEAVTTAYATIVATIVAGALVHEPSRRAHKRAATPRCPPLDLVGKAGELVAADARRLPLCRLSREPSRRARKLESLRWGGVGRVRNPSHRIASHRIASHRIASHRIPSHRIASHRIASHRISSQNRRKRKVHPLSRSGT